MNRKAHYRTNVQGESLEKKIVELRGELYENLFPIFYFGILTLFYWLIAIGLLVVNITGAILFTLVFIIILYKSIKKHRKISKQLRLYNKGLDGERMVGSIIEKLSSDKDYVFHDIVCKYNSNEKVVCNIDHVIVSTKGIFAIDTKNKTLFDRNYNQPDYIFDEDFLVDSTGVFQKKIKNQIDYEAEFLENKIKEWLGKEYSVKRVCVIIGAYVKHEQGDFSKYWFVNENSFTTLFKKACDEIDIQDVQRISDNLRRYAEKVIK